MRLKDVYLLCEDYVERWPYLSIGQLFDREISETCYTLNIRSTTWKEIVKSLDDLEQIEALSSTIKEIKDIFLKNGEVREIYVEIAKENIVNKFNLLYLQVKTIRDLCESFGYLKGEYIGFDIKIPVKEDFAIMVKTLNNFNKIINQAPFLNVSDAIIQYRKVDLGSTWIEFVITGTAAISLLGVFSVFVDNCIAILSHKRSCQQQEEYYRRMKISNNLVEEMTKAHQEMEKVLTDKFISELIREKGPEEEARAKLCFDMMIELLDEGVEIYQAITKNESDKLLFPTLDQWKTISSNPLKNESIEEQQES